MSDQSQNTSTPNPGTPNPTTPNPTSAPETPNPSPTHPDPRVSAFRHLFLLHLPQPWRETVQRVGELVFEASLEHWGMAPGSHRSVMADRAEALAADLEVLAAQLTALAREAEASEMSEHEVELCERAAEGVPAVTGVVARLQRAAAAVEGERRARTALR